MSGYGQRDESETYQPHWKQQPGGRRQLPSVSAPSPLPARGRRARRPRVMNLERVPGPGGDGRTFAGLQVDGSPVRTRPARDH